MLEGIQQALQTVVEVVGSVGRWVDIDFDRQGAGQWLAARSREDRAHRCAVGPSFTTDQDAIADVAIESIGRNWVREKEFHFPYRFRRGRSRSGDLDRLNHGGLDQPRFQGGVVAAATGLGAEGAVVATCRWG